MSESSFAFDSFPDRHIGPRDSDLAAMLQTVEAESLDALIDATIPESIRLRTPLNLDPPRSESEATDELRAIATRNRVLRSLIGMGYYGTITPPVIQRNILENPGWYTQYTPYQAEISQGRLEALINFQTMVADLTGLDVANASLLDEATAAAEAMQMCRRIGADDRRAFFVAHDCHPQTIGVVRTRARPLNIDVVVAAPEDAVLDPGRYFGILLQYPNTYGAICDLSSIAAKAGTAGTLIVVATDLLALTLVKPPGDWGADVAIGSTQRFGVPLGGGGPHAAFLATREAYVRQIPGRLVGVSKDAEGRPAYRLAIQTREQHIRREKATSNICTSQVLLAVMAGMYAVYHGPDGLRRIARRIHRLTQLLARGLQTAKHDVLSRSYFDTLRVRPRDRSAARWIAAACDAGFNLRDCGDGTIGISLDECATLDEVRALWRIFGVKGESADAAADSPDAPPAFPRELARTRAFMTHPVFHRYRSEHEMLRYIKRLEARDLSLTTSMIPLGSCTMKLNAAAEMFPISWPEFAAIHPFAPADQQQGYAELCRQLATWLAEITGLEAVSFQPNSGAQGEYAGLLAIRAFHEHRGQAHRDVCLIPTSAHGTNPASAVTAGFSVVPVECDPAGNIDVEDLQSKARTHADRLGALMITYPSTHGVFEARVRDICRIVHDHGGQVYMDGANMNAQVGLCRPAEIGADVCHLNLHKTFCIPHGGGGPGMGPIAVASHLAPFLPRHPLAIAIDAGASDSAARAVGPVAAAPLGSAGILAISWMYIRMMGGSGLTRATQFAILNANYMAARLREHYAILYTGNRNRVAHEFILDCRAFEKSAGIRVEDIAKRLMDYGFHAPTMSWPVPGTLMIEPTESESKEELDRLCDALIAIRAEIRAIESGRDDRNDNAIRNAPHTATAIARSDWPHRYSRELAAFPSEWVRGHKFWPPVARIDNVYGDRHLFCTCVSVDEAAPK
ncbi:MAG: aminomethyl-transferring glycine dehydrogenase [Phycisphaerae bacterium]|nr:aminomethyl-transferring glycine dehydrogenase [Phycisphaerae bacterium]